MQPNTLEITSHCLTDCSSYLKRRKKPPHCLSGYRRHGQAISKCSGHHRPHTISSGVPKEPSTQIKYCYSTERAHRPCLRQVGRLTDSAPLQEALNQHVCSPPPAPTSGAFPFHTEYRQEDTLYHDTHPLAHSPETFRQTLLSCPYPARLSIRGHASPLPAPVSQVWAGPLRCPL